MHHGCRGQACSVACLRTSATRRGLPRAMRSQAIGKQGGDEYVSQPRHNAAQALRAQVWPGLSMHSNLVCPCNANRLQSLQARCWMTPRCPLTLTLLRTPPCPLRATAPVATARPTPLDTAPPSARARAARAAGAAATATAMAIATATAAAAEAVAGRMRATRRACCTRSRRACSPHCSRCVSRTARLRPALPRALWRPAANLQCCRRVTQGTSQLQTWYHRHAHSTRKQACRHASCKPINAMSQVRLMRGALKGQEFTAREAQGAAPGHSYEIPASTKYSQGVLAVYEACRRAPYDCRKPALAPASHLEVTCSCIYTVLAGGAGTCTLLATNTAHVLCTALRCLVALLSRVPGANRGAMIQIASLFPRRGLHTSRHLV
jgi:hypothetical protein